MAKIKEGWRLMVVDPGGVVRDSIDLGGDDLSAPLTRAIICEDIADIINRAES